MKIIFLAILVVTLFSCNTYSDNQIEDFDTEIKTYIKKNKIEYESSVSGLYFKIKEEGDGDYIQAKDVVSFTYKGTFLNGEVFDEQTSPVEFGVVELIAAWKEIMYKLKVGGKASLICPPQLGYGNHDLDDIPANSILLYQIEIINVK